MAFISVADFLSMGGYGFYVWLAYGLSFFSLTVLIITTRNKRDKIFKLVRQRLARQQRVKKAQNRDVL